MLGSHGEKNSQEHHPMTDKQCRILKTKRHGRHLQACPEIFPGGGQLNSNSLLHLISFVIVPAVYQSILTNHPIFTVCVVWIFQSLLAHCIK